MRLRDRELVQILGFNLRALWRVPGAFVAIISTVVGVLLVAAAIILLLLSDKKLGNKVLGWSSLQGIPRTWGIAVLCVAFLYVLATANYREARQLGAQTANRVVDPPSPTQITIQAAPGSVVVVGSNTAQPQAVLQQPPPQETQTETESGQ